MHESLFLQSRQEIKRVGGCFPQLQFDFCCCWQWWRGPAWFLCSWFGCCIPSKKQAASRKEGLVLSCSPETCQGPYHGGGGGSREGRSGEPQCDAGSWPRGAGRDRCREEQRVFWHPIRLIGTRTPALGARLGGGCERERCPGQLQRDFQLALLGVPTAFGPAKSPQ